VPRAASIRCIQDSLLLSLSPASFARMEEDHPKAASRIMKNLMGNVGERLKKTTDNEVSALKVELQNSLVRSKANLFFSYVIGLLCVYNLAVQVLINLSLDTNRASLISAGTILVFCGVLVLMIRQSELPIYMFGLTTRGWKPALTESMTWTVVIILVLVSVKWALVSFVPKYQHLPVFGFDPVHTKYLAFNFALYGLHSPVQEFIARGVLQGSLQHFFRGKNVTWRAILISNALFSATHVHLLGGMLGLVVFVPGLFWGWLYSRHENLIGVSISHLLIGWTALFFLNMETLF
jgi:CRP/FNR family transcriptional regulator, cyclic AMP receptor protein